MSFTNIRSLSGNSFGMCSRNGNVVSYALTSGPVWVSTDYGSNWSNPIPYGQGWQSACMTPDGSKIFLTTYIFYPVIVTTSDMNYQYLYEFYPNQTHAIFGAYISPDGSHLACYDGTSYVERYSSDGGASWSYAGMYYACPTSQAVSRDGTSRIYGGNWTSYLCGSSDFGVTWFTITRPWVWSPQFVPTNFATNGDGSTIIMANGQNPGDVMYLSRDFGATWVATASSRNWTSVAISSNGAVAYATVWYGNIWKGVLDPPTITSLNNPSGLVGATIYVYGTLFTGATAVRFNGVPAISFGVNADDLFHAVVPVGATTGTISIDAPSGTATSTAVFTVTKPGTSKFFEVL